MTPSPREVREAIFYAEQYWAFSEPDNDVRDVLVEAAQAWLDERPICENCEGSGADSSQCESPMCGITEHCGCRTCPSCNGRGWVFNGERVKAAAKTVERWNLDYSEAIARAAILAYLENPALVVEGGNE